MTNYRNRIKLMQNIQSVLIVLCIIGIAAFFYYISLPEINEFAEKDECGLVGGQLMHSIPSSGVCENKCYSYCLSVEQEYDDSRFTLNENDCHECICLCKKFK